MGNLFPVFFFQKEVPYAKDQVTMNVLLLTGLFEAARGMKTFSWTRQGEDDMAIKADTNMTIRMNREVKQQAQQIFANLGMDMTTAINVFLRQAISYRGFPFEVTLNTPNAVTLTAMDVAENNENMYGLFDSVSSLMDALNA